MTQLSFFDEPAAEPLPLPRGAKPARQEARYSDYSAKGKRCGDCEQLIYQRLMEQQPAPHVRRARVKRVEGDEVTFLCQEHAQERRQLDARAAS